MSYQLNSTANLAHSPQNWTKLVKSVLLLSWYLQNGFDLFNCHGCRLFFILCEIHCYFCPHIFWVYYFSLIQCSVSKLFIGPPESSSRSNKSITDLKSGVIYSTSRNKTLPGSIDHDREPIWKKKEKNKFIKSWILSQLFCCDICFFLPLIKDLWKKGRNTQNFAISPYLSII